MKTITATVCACAILSVGSTASAQDVALRLVNNQIFTTSVDGEPPNQTFGTDEARVYGAEFDFDQTFAGLVAIDAPGFASNDVGILGQSVRLFLRGPTRRWDGSAFQTETQFTLATGLPDLGVPFQTLPASGIVAGSNFNVLEDFHFDWTLNNATGTTGQGIYLAELDLRANAGQGYLDSKPFFIVFSYGADEDDLAAATAYVGDVIVPAPGTATLALAGLALGIGSRRRR